MAHAYTPGLRVTERTTIYKERRLPIAGKVLVKQGDRVRPDDVVALAELPGDVATVNVVNQLGISANEVPGYMLNESATLWRGDSVIAETRPWIKWLKSVVRSPADGVIETISEITGQVLIRMAPEPVELRAYVDGNVVEVVEREGVVVETRGVLVQGIFGIGGETHGDLVVAAQGPDSMLGPDDLGPSLKGKIVVAWAQVTSEVYERASELGLAALVCGGFRDSDLRRLLGYDLGVAITGHEDVQPILILTEGFGRIAMADATFELLKAHEGQHASANGATQIRAGVLRPEIIIPASDRAPYMPADVTEVLHVGLTEGSPVRIIREPGFGRIGKVKRLPAGVVAVETEAKVRVAEVEFPGGQTAVVPRANLEAIER